MARVPAGFIAILAGLAATLGVVWFWVSGGGESNGGDTFGWTVIVGLFTLPVIGAAMAMGILFLEGLATWLKRPRVPVILLGSVLIPIGLALVLGGPYLIGMIFNPSASHSVITALIMSAAAIAPCFVTCAVYAALSAKTRDA